MRYITAWYVAQTERPKVAKCHMRWWSSVLPLKLVDIGLWHFTVTCCLSLSGRQNCSSDLYHWLRSASHSSVLNWCAVLTIRLSQDWNVTARHNARLLHLMTKLQHSEPRLNGDLFQHGRTEWLEEKSGWQKGHYDRKVEEKQSLFVLPLRAIEWPFIQQGTITQSCAYRLAFMLVHQAHMAPHGTQHVTHKRRLRGHRSTFP